MTEAGPASAVTTARPAFAWTTRSWPPQAKGYRPSRAVEVGVQGLRLELLPEPALRPAREILFFSPGKEAIH